MELSEISLAKVSWSWRVCSRNPVYSNDGIWSD